MNKQAYDALKKACETFVQKVKSGNARSVRSYAEMTAALKLTEEQQDLFAAEKIREAYIDGFNDSRFDFSIENYQD